MKPQKLISAVLAIFAGLIAFGLSPAHAQLVARDANGAKQNMCAATGSNGWLWPCQILSGVDLSGVPHQILTDTQGNFLNLPLPAGAATSANQLSEINALNTIVTNSGAGSTAANQSTEITALTTIATNSAFLSTIANNTTGASTATNQATQITAEQASAAALGAKGDTVCAGDSGTCSVIALLERNNARASSTISALGSPMQSGGSIGNTGFNALQGGAANSASNPFYFSPSTGATFSISNSSFGANLQLAGTAVATGANASASAPSNVPAVAPLGNLSYSETTTALGASASFTGSSHTTPVWATYFNTTFWADQVSGGSGAEIDCSVDNTTFRAVATTTLAASVASPLSVFASCPYYRVKLTNGGTAQGNVQVTSSYTGG